MPFWYHKMPCIAISVRWKFCNTWHRRFSRAADVCCMV